MARKSEQGSGAGEKKGGGVGDRANWEIKALRWVEGSFLDTSRFRKENVAPLAWEDRMRVWYVTT